MSATIQASLLFYRIPQSTRFPNPSRRLRRIAVRLDGSVWAIPNHLVPHSYCHTMTEAGVTWYTLPFDTRESEKLVKIAHDHLRQEINAAVSRTRRSLSKAEAEFHTTPEGKTQMSIADFEARTQKAVKRAKELLGDLEEAARVFEIDPATLPVSWAAAQADLIGQTARSRAKAFAEAGVKARGIGGSDGAGLANAVEADAVPAGVVADFLLENGAETEGNALISVFAEPEPATNDDDDDDDDDSWENGGSDKMPWE